MSDNFFQTGEGEGSRANIINPSTGVGSSESIQAQVAGTRTTRGVCLKSEDSSFPLRTGGFTDKVADGGRQGSTRHNSGPSKEAEQSSDLTRSTG
ncbi:unnamed protein product [Tetraodon nigroviridis]|uniref:(spotted green pufferfish) hypothetical protein n=1 Tax=Tetraodon nigroviridis TaxID=99883 RepID=Q4SWT8_TETNG|nr:unnamed protein product [Tetraodon nigroviridis]